MIRPHLDYIDFVIDSSSVDRVKRLDTLQNKALRRIEYCMIKENRLEYSVLQKKYNIEDLRLRRDRNLIKIMHAKSPVLKSVDSESHSIELRSNSKVKIKMDNTAKTRVFNSPLHRGTRLWNLLPINLQKEKDKFVFKKKLWEGKMIDIYIIHWRKKLNYISKTKSPKTVLKPIGQVCITILIL